jgi:hypothetical protein
LLRLVVAFALDAHNILLMQATPVAAPLNKPPNSVVIFNQFSASQQSWVMN